MIILNKIIKSSFWKKSSRISVFSTKSALGWKTSVCPKHNYINIMSIKKASIYSSTILQ